MNSARRFHYGSGQHDPTEKPDIRKQSYPKTINQNACKPGGVHIRAALNAATNKTDPRSRWVTALAGRRNKNIATVALANKNARIAWAILAKGETYRAAA